MIDKTHIFAALVPLVFGISTPLVASDSVPIGARALYVPGGFDDNDHVAVTIEGSLPDSCYQLDSIRVDADPATQTIVINPKAWITPRPQCTPGPFAFQSEVELGTLAKGTWRLIVEGTPIEKDLVIVAAASSGQDDYIYAPVDSVTVERSSDSQLYAKLMGVIGSDCVEYKETQILDQGDVIVLLPILEVVSTTCHQNDRLFTQKVALPPKAPGRYLLHVRSLNGKAVNRIYQVNAL